MSVRSLRPCTFSAKNKRLHYILSLRLILKAMYRKITFYSWFPTVLELPESYSTILRSELCITVTFMCIYLAFYHVKLLFKIILISAAWTHRITEPGKFPFSLTTSDIVCTDVVIQNVDHIEMP